MNARGSLYESLNHLIDAYDEKYISQEQYDLLESLLNGYVSWLRKMERT